MTPLWFSTITLSQLLKKISNKLYTVVIINIIIIISNINIK